MRLFSDPCPKLFNRQNHRLLSASGHFSFLFSTVQPFDFLLPLPWGAPSCSGPPHLSVLFLTHYCRWCQASSWQLHPYSCGHGCRQGRTTSNPLHSNTESWPGRVLLETQLSLWWNAKALLQTWWDALELGGPFTPQQKFTGLGLWARIGQATEQSQLEILKNPNPWILYLGISGRDLIWCLVICVLLNSSR